MSDQRTRQTARDVRSDCLTKTAYTNSAHDDQRNSGRQQNPILRLTGAKLRKGLVQRC
jgi:hypothetical protein